jgi:hypothetical protein
LEQSADATPPLVAAPRHLRRRRLHEEIPDALLVPGAEPLPLEPARTASERTAPAKRAAELDPDDEEATYRRKRLVALVTVLCVFISVPALVMALLLLG